MLKPVAVVCALIAATFAFVSKAAASPCEPAVHVDGDGEVAREVILDLVIRGIPSQAAPDCPLVRVHVEAQPDSVRVIITDPYGKTERSVGAPATASALAASWAEDVVARGAPSAMPPSSTLQLVDTGGEQGAKTPTSGISILYETALDANHLRWQGVALAVCGQLGPVCIGGLVRGGEGRYRGESTPIGMPYLSRAAGLDLLATVSVPVRVGELVVAPELDVGLGWMELTWAHYDTKQLSESSQPEGYRVGVRVSVSRWLWSGFAIDGALGINALPTNYTRFDVPLAPIERYEINPEVRLAIGIRH